MTPTSSHTRRHARGLRVDGAIRTWDDRSRRSIIRRRASAPSLWILAVVGAGASVGACAQAASPEDAAWIIIDRDGDPQPGQPDAFSWIDGVPCTPACAGHPCGSPNGCGGTCAAGSGCCTPDCDGKDCGAADGCGGTCQTGSGCCTPSCTGKTCGASDGCGGTCQAGSGCCTPSCTGKTCGASDGCGGTCQAGSGCCTPSCDDKLCGEGNGCGGTCQAGSGCCTPDCDGAVCGGDDGCGDTCHGDNNDPCSAPAETWRCVWIDYFGTWGSQVCRGGKWVTFHLNPRSCGTCCGSFSSACCVSSGC